MGHSQIHQFQLDHTVNETWCETTNSGTNKLRNKVATLTNLCVLSLFAMLARVPRSCSIWLTCTPLFLFFLVLSFLFFLSFFVLCVCATDSYNASNAVVDGKSSSLEFLSQQPFTVSLILLSVLFHVVFLFLFLSLSHPVFLSFSLLCHEGMF